MTVLCSRPERPADVPAAPPEAARGTGVLRLGTCGWSHAHWRGSFYPHGLAEPDWLPYYAQRFSTVEVNSSFYRLPSTWTLAAWRQDVPAGFVFAVKASRFITHLKKLADPAQTLPPFLQRVRRLEPQLGPLLFQLPPRWRRDERRLRAFLDALPAGFRYVLEFRDPSWFDLRVLDQLRAAGVGFCIHESARMRGPLAVTADFAYLRLSGADPGLQPWAATIARWLAAGRDVYCYLDDDSAARAAANAARLRALLEA